MCQQFRVGGSSQAPVFSGDRTASVRVDDWPGVSSTPWLRDGTVITGVWTSHTDETNASQLKGHVEIPGEFDTVYELQMTPLPCFANTPQDPWRAAVRALLHDIHDEFDAAREAKGTLPLGPERILGTDPFARMLRSKHGRAPTVLVLDPIIRRGAIAQLRTLEAQWRETAVAAWQLLTAGEVTRRKKLPATSWRALAMWRGTGGDACTFGDGAHGRGFLVGWERGSAAVTPSGANGHVSDGAAA